MMSSLPNYWGGRQLFAFSGYDGATSWAHPFVGSVTDEVLVVDFHQSPAVRLRITAADGTALRAEPEYVVNDAAHVRLVGEGLSSEARFAFADHWALVGEVGPGLRVELVDQPDEVSAGSGHWALRRDCAGRRFALALDPDSPEQARARAAAGLTCDVGAVAAARLGFVRGLAERGVPEGIDTRCYLKAATILKVNTYSPEGRIARRWTTPDRWPHRHMWLWDSAFHALGWVWLDPDMAWDALLAMTDSAYPDGRLAITVMPDQDYPREISQPPILAWAAWDMHRVAPNPERLGEAYAPLTGYVNWFQQARDRNGNGLLEWWKDEDDTLCHCGESGWDNSPRFDERGLDDHIDLSCMIVRELQCLAEIADVLGKPEDAAQWREREAKLRAAINAHMWDETTGFYYDLRPDGSRYALKTAAGFLPLWAGVASAAQAERLRQHFNDPAEFASALPVPTVAMNEPTYSDDMWRGPTWLNVNYFIFQGLRRYGFAAEAAHLRAASLREVERWQAHDGSIHEFYDTEARRHPYALHRKGGVGTAGGYGMGTIADYNFTTAMYLTLAHEEA